MPPATNHSKSSPATDRQRQTVLSVEQEIASTCTVVRLTFGPAALRWIKRIVVAQLALDTAAMVGSSTWTFVRAHL
jgi:hypothetical protein